MIIGLTNKYVHNLCKQLTGSYFIGTYPCDVLLKKRKTILARMKKEVPFSIDVNLSPSHQDGSHFIAMSYSKKKLELFDSLTLPYRDPNIVKFIDSLKKDKDFSFTKTKVSIQSPKSLACGFFCIAYVLSKSRNHDTQEFLDLFYKEKKMLSYNDKLVIRQIKKFILL